MSEEHGKPELRDDSATFLHRFCITHKKPLLPATWYDSCIAMGNYDPNSALHVRNLDPFWHAARPIAYSAAGAYVLPIAIRKFAKDAELIEICSYRKRILRSTEGTASPGHPGLWELRLEDCCDKPEISPTTPHISGTFLVSEPIDFGFSMLEEYKLCHRLRDLLDYTALAIEMNILDEGSAKSFLSATRLIPGGLDLGIFPKPWLVGALAKLECLGREFLSRFGDRVREYDSYQVRAVGFLAERLGSFFLLRHLEEIYSGGIPDEVFGYLTVIAESDVAYSVGISEPDDTC